MSCNFEMGRNKAYLVDGATKTVGARVALGSDESLVSMKWRV